MPYSPWNATPNSLNPNQGGVRGRALCRGLQAAKRALGADAQVARRQHGECCPENGSGRAEAALLRGRGAPAAAPGASRRARTRTRAPPAHARALAHSNHLPASTARGFLASLTLQCFADGLFARPRAGQPAAGAPGRRRALPDAPPGCGHQRAAAVWQDARRGAWRHEAVQVHSRRPECLLCLLGGVGGGRAVSGRVLAPRLARFAARARCSPKRCSQPLVARPQTLHLLNANNNLDARPPGTAPWPRST